MLDQASSRTVTSSLAPKPRVEPLGRDRRDDQRSIFDLAESERRFRTIVESLDDPICRFLPDGTLTYANPAYARLVGKSTEELIGADVFGLMSEPERTVRRRQLSALDANRPVARFDQRLLLPDGRTHRLQWSDRACFDEQGKLREIQAVGRDVTEFTQADSEPAQCRQLIHSTFDALSKRIAILDSAGRLLAINAAWRDTAGGAGLIGAGCPIGEDYPRFCESSEMNCPDSARDIAQGIREVATGGRRGFQMEYCYPDILDGRWYVVRIAPVATGDGVVVAHEDVSERKRSESQLRLTQFSVDQAAESIFWADCTGRFRYVNESACRKLGYTREELLAMRVQDIDVNVDQQWWWRHWDQMTGADGGAIETLHRRKDGSTYPVEISLKYFQFEGHEYVCSFVRDITKRRRAERAMRGLSAQILQAQEAERRRVARELHDGVNQILSSVKFGCHSVEKLLGVDDGAIDQAVRTVNAHLDTAIAEVRRISQSLRPSVLDDLGLVSAIRSACEAFRTRTGIDVEENLTDLSERLAGNVELALYRMLQEALGNIEKHSEATAVSVDLRADHDYVTMRIRDNGRGFQRQAVKAARSSAAGGLGLLHIRERAIFLSGTARILSRIGRGTEVFVQIPSFDADHASTGHDG